MINVKLFFGGGEWGIGFICISKEKFRYCYIGAVLLE